MSRTARPRHRLVRFAVVAWMAASVGTTAGFATVVLVDALLYRHIDAGQLLVCGGAVVSAWLAARTGDDLTDLEVLGRVRSHNLPCTAEALALEMGRRPGPVRLSLLRLHRAGAVAVETVDGADLYTAR